MAYSSTSDTMQPSQQHHPHHHHHPTHHQMHHHEEPQQHHHHHHHDVDHKDAGVVDPLAPLEWSLDSGASSEDVSLALLNVVELEEQDEDDDDEEEDNAFTPNHSHHDDDGTSSPEERNKRKREEEEEGQVILPAVNGGEHESSSGAANAGLMMTADERPRVSRRRKKKPKGLPKRPMNAFAIFYHQERLRMVESMHEGSLSEDDIQRHVGKMWRALPEEEVCKFEKRAEEDKARYHEEMEAYHGNGNSTGNNMKAPPKNSNDMRKDLEDEQRGHNSMAYDFPPPPPGVMVISNHPSQNGSSGRESVASNASGRRDCSNPASPIPPPTISSRGWTYQPPPPAVPQMQQHQAYASAQQQSPSRGAGRLVHHGGPYAEYYHPPQAHMPPPSWGAAPPSPYSRRSSIGHPSPHQTMSPTSSSRAYSPHVAHGAYPSGPPPGPAPPSAHSYSIPPGMELALPARNGGEQKYKVSYRCYTMRKEDVASFMASLNATHTAPGSPVQHQPPRPSTVTRSESLPPRPSSAYSHAHAHAPAGHPMIHPRPSW